MKAAAEAEQTGDRVTMTRALTGLGATLAELGEFTAAHDAFLRVLDLCQRLGDSVNGTGALANIGQMQSVLGLYGKSLEYASRAVDWAAERSMQGMHLRVRIIRAGVLAKLGAVQSVSQELQHVRELSESDRYDGQMLAVQAEAALQLPLGVEGPDSLEDAFELFEKNDIEDEKFRVQLLLARRSHRDRQMELAFEHVDVVAKGAAALRLPDLVVEAEILRAELLVEKKPQVALDRVTRTLELARRFGFRDSMWRGEALLAKLHESSDRTVALAHYQACLDLFREMTEGLPQHLAHSFLRLPRQQDVLNSLKSL